MIEPVFEKISFNKREPKIQEQIKIEQIETIT